MSLLYFFNLSNYTAQLFSLSLGITHRLNLIKLCNFEITTDLVFVSHDVIEDSTYALHFRLSLLRCVRADAFADRYVSLYSERERFFLDIFPSQSLTVKSTLHGIYLILKLYILTFHDLDPRASFSFIGNGLPFEAFALEKCFEFGINLELAVMILF